MRSTSLRIKRLQCPSGLARRPPPERRAGRSSQVLVSRSPRSASGPAGPPSRRSTPGSMRAGSGAGDARQGLPYDAKRKIVSLIETLEMLTTREPEQEVQGIALPVLDAVIEAVGPDPPLQTLVHRARRLHSPRAELASRARVRRPRLVRGQAAPRA